MRSAILLISVLSAACANDDQGAGNAELGIASFTATESGDRATIEGLDAAGKVIASVRLRTGAVSIPDEQIHGEGREMIVEIRGKVVTHASVGFDELALPRLGDVEIDGLLTDPYVGATLTRWGIGFAPLPVQVPDALTLGEAAYSHYGSCAGFVPPCQGTAYTDCCLTHPNASGYYYQTVVCGNMASPTYARRSCSYAYGPTACGTAGPGGCAVCFSSTYDAANEGKMTVYNPYMNPDQCEVTSCKYLGSECTSNSQCCGGWCGGSGGGTYGECI